MTRIWADGRYALMVRFIGGRSVVESINGV